MNQPKQSIRKFLLISLSLLSITPLILLSAILSWDNYVTHKREVNEIQELMSNVALQKIKNYIDEQRILLLSTIKATNIVKLNQHDKENILSMLLSSTVNSEYGKVFQDLILVNEKGIEEVHISRTEIFVKSDLSDLSAERAYKAIREGEEIHYEPVYFDKKTGEPLLIISLPVKDVRSGKTVAVLIAHIRMRYMLDIIAKIDIGQSGIAYVLDSNGRVISHPNPSVVLKETYFDLENRSSVSSGLDSSRAVIAWKEMILGKVKYYIVTEIPVKEAFSYIRHSLLVTIVLSLITLIASMVLIYLLYRKIIKPVELLTLTAEAISNGDYDQKADASSTDEFSSLAGSFNFMTSKLLENIKSLEENIDERKAVEKKLVLSVKEKEILLREVHHRVKNNMQVINSLLNMQIKKMHDKNDIEMVKASQMRIRSMSLIHEKLYRSESLVNIDFRQYVSDLVELLVNTYKGYSYKINFHLDIKEVMLDLDLAISCGFIINELITNALKYAFPNYEEGNIYININKKNDHHIEIVVRDDGIGIDPGIDIKNTDSIGLGLVTMLAELQLGGKIELSRDAGTVFKIFFKDRRKDQSDK